MTGMKIFYDGACPVCRREIRFYKQRAGAAGFQWLDVNNLSEEFIPSGHSRDDLLRRFHVQHPTEGVVSGTTAFALLWQEMFGWSWLLRAVKLPVVRETCELGYTIFLFLRGTFIRRGSCDLDTREAR